MLLTRPGLSLAATLEGVVLTERGPLAGARVCAYRTFNDLAADVPAFISEPGEKPGFFKMRLPRGTYYFAARGTAGGRKFFSYHGANPIAVEEGGEIWLPFMAVPSGSAKARDAPAPRLRGVVTFKGDPVAGAQVSLYPPRGEPFRGLGLLSATTSPDGSFEFTPLEGEYVAIARKRRGGRGMEPLKRGDLFCFFSRNPVTIRPSKDIEIEIPCYPKEALRAFLDKGALRLVKRTRASAVRFRERAPPPAAGKGGELRGRVVDPAGRPLGGLFVMAYASHGLFQMHILRDKPAYLAETGPDGFFRIEVEKAGRYVLVARGRAGGAPEPGEYFGLYEGDAGHAAPVGGGVSGNADIVVSPVMADSIKSINDKAQVPAAPSPPVVSGPLGDTVLGEDATWEGEVIVEGVVVVGRRATLTIRAGATVRFARIDRNGDGVGDGELRVLGRLLVRGEAGSPVRFTSAEKENPRPADWSYVLLFASRGESVIEHGIFEYAFTGVQVHFSKALIRDSVFRKNVEGLRFGRAELVVENSEIAENTYGIRQHRIEGPVRIVGNDIAGNRVGVFLVPSGQNTLDFSAEGYRADERYRSPSVVRGNNIAGNREYNYRLGERFRYDIDLANNWWGSARPEEIAKGIFDRYDDPSLGRVVFRPFLTRPARPSKSTGERSDAP